MSRQHAHTVSYQSLRRILLVVAVGMSLAGCSGSSFIARKFDDFTAHYNKFYNANRTIQEQERKLEEGDPKIDTDRYLPVYEIPKQQGRSAEFEKVITKCADLLRNHPKSKWVDDALMLIGKSYFYQSNYVGAEQKFKEVINLNGSLKDEAEFWLARTLVAGQSTSAAEDVIGAALAEEDLDREWRSQFLLLRGDLRTEVGDWPSAIEDVEAGLEHVKDSDTAARGYFLLGQLYETNGQYKASVDAYHRVQDKNPLYELSYAAMVNEIRVQGLQVDADAALGKLERMMRDNKHFQNRNALQLLHARVLAADGDPEAARESLLDQLYPSDPTKKTSLRGEAHYRLAELYRDYLGDFYEAGLHFDTASSVLRTLPAQNEHFTPDAINDAKTTASTFRDYRETLDRVARMDSLLYLGSLDRAAFDSAVAVVRIQLAEQAARIQEELERRKTQSRFRQAATDLNTGTPTSSNATTSPNTGQGSAFGFLNYKNIQRVQEAFLNFKEVWGDRPLVPGWRREEAILVAQREAADASKEGANGEEDFKDEKVRFLPPVDVSEVPRDSASQAAMRADRAEARYRLANVLFLSIGLPDSAAKWYRLVIDEDADQPVARRALYAMAEVHEALGDSVATRRTLERIIDQYPESSYAERARVRLGLATETEKAVPDTVEVAMGRYEAAYGLWVRGRYDQAIDAMVRTAADYPKLDVAAKALLAAGRIYLEKAHFDGLDYYGVIPLGDSLFSNQEIEDAVAAAAPPEEEAAATDTTTAPPEEAAVEQDSTRTPDRVAAEQPPEPAEAADSAATASRTDELKVVTEPGGNAVPDKQVRPERDEEALRAVAESQGQIKEAADAGLQRAGDARLNEKKELRKRPAARDTANSRAEGKSKPTAEQMAALPAGGDSLLTPEAAPRAGVEQPSPAAAVDTAAAGRESARAKPAKIPEIVWTEPDYFVHDLIPVPLTLRSLYSTVETHFGSTPYGKRAADLRKGLEAARTALAVAEMKSDETGAEQAPKEVGPAPDDAETTRPNAPGEPSESGASPAGREIEPGRQPDPVPDDSMRTSAPDSVPPMPPPGDP